MEGLVFLALEILAVLEVPEVTEEEELLEVPEELQLLDRPIMVRLELLL